MPPMPVYVQDEVKEPSPIKNRKGRKRYSPDIEAKLDIAREIYSKYDKNNNNNVAESQVKNMMTETFQRLGMSSVNPTEADIDVWLDMGDFNRNGLISGEEFDDICI